jgi:hypothetical protein
MSQDLSNFRPSRLWRRMPLDRRVDAATLFWEDEHSADQQMEAVASIATHMKFRTRSVVGLPVEKKAKYLSTLPTISDAIAARALVSYHLARQRPMMAAFLDVLGIPHQEGLITEENVVKPEAARLQQGAAELAVKFPAEDVALYLGTLVSQDPDTWGTLADLPEAGALVRS